VDIWKLASLNNSFTGATAQESSLHSSLNLETGLFISIFDGTIAITGTLGNLLVLTVIFVQIRFSTVSNILIANVAAVDLLTAAVIIPGDIGRNVCERMGLCHISPTTILLYVILVHYVITAATVALFVIAVERFTAIAFPFRYRSLFTRTRAKICVAATWISGVLITGIFVGLNFLFIMTILCLLLILSTIALYIYIFSIALKHEKKIVSLRVQYPDLKRSTMHPWERKSTKTMAIVLGVYLTCWVPSVVFYSVLRPENFLYHRIQPWINSVYYLSAVLNPFIYGLRSEKFRKEVTRLVNKLCPMDTIRSK
ncbi:adenosine receptor A2a-like, partial [Acropora millepora]|uniref:adenosine receptor A2a-like n=1 Tax=Acropora millepora TaxID=45264 RepID=UPI001CF46527